MSSAVQASQPCSYCQKQATQPCHGCHGAPGYEKEESVETNYCNAACQKADWDSHRELCERLRARKTLFRAADTIQQIFYLYQKNKWVWNLEKVERVQDSWHQHDDEPIEKCNLLYFYISTQFIGRFPHAFPDSLFIGDREKESALAYMNCHDSILSMHDMVKSMLQGICSEIEEVVVEPKNDPLKMITIDADGIRDSTYYHHELFRVTTENKETYALDLTSAQYGYYEPIVPWNSYEKLRVRKISKVLSFGQTRINELLAQEKDRPWEQKIYDAFLTGSGACLNLALLGWEALNISFKTLLRLPDEDFAKVRGELYASIGADMEFMIPEVFKKIMDG